MTEIQSRIFKFLQEYERKWGDCVPSHGEIAEALDLSKASVGRTLSRLREAGRIEIQERWMEHPCDGRQSFEIDPLEASSLRMSFGKRRSSYVYRAGNRYRLLTGRIMSTCRNWLS